MPRAGWKKPVSERRLSDLVSVGVLTRVFSPGLVDEVIAAAGRTERRNRVLPARKVEGEHLVIAGGSRAPRWMRMAATRCARTETVGSYSPGCRCFCVGARRSRTDRQI